jgi:hypothetical protein
VYKGVVPCTSLPEHRLASTSVAYMLPMASIWHTQKKKKKTVTGYNGHASTAPPAKLVNFAQLQCKVVPQFICATPA